MRSTFGLLEGAEFSCSWEQAFKLRENHWTLRGSSRVTRLVVPSAAGTLRGLGPLMKLD